MGKADDIQALKEWRTYYNNLQKDTAVDTLSSLERAQKRKNLEKNPVEWIKFFFSQYATHEFAPFHIKAINRICKNEEWYEVLSWSRELAKSTTVMMCVMYLVCTGKKRNILLISNSKDNATRLLKPYKDPDIVNKKWDWFEGAAFPTRSISGKLLVVFCGNIIALDCCVKRAGEKADHWDVVNIRDKNGKSTWAAKNTEADIDRVLSKLSTRIIQQEFYNNPLSEGEVFKELTWGKCPPLSKLQLAVAYGDPAPSNSRNKATSFKALFLIGYYDGNFYIYKGFLDHVVNDEYVNWYYYIHDYVGDKCQVFYFIENNKLQDPFYEQVFLPLFAAKGQEKGFIPISPDTRKKPEKFDRIEGNLEPLNRQGKLILNIDEKDNPHMQRLEEQFLLLNKRMKAPADGVDCIEGGWYILNSKIRTLTVDSYTIGQHKRSNKRY